MPSIGRASSTNANSVFYRWFYNLDKIHRLSYSVVSKVYR
jgi:hypothetical protein